LVWARRNPSISGGLDSSITLDDSNNPCVAYFAPGGSSPQIKIMIGEPK